MDSVYEFGRNLLAAKDLDGEAMRRWRLVVGYPKYRVSNDGLVRTTHVRSKSKDGFLALVSDKDGYLIAGLWDDIQKKQVRRRVAGLVLTAFIGARPEGMEACHRDGNRRNNQLTNLRWDTPKGNHADAVRAGTHTGFTKKGEANPFVKLTSEQVLEIRMLINELPYCLYGGKKLLAERFKISTSNLRDILLRNIWRHI